MAIDPPKDKKDDKSNFEIKGADSAMAEALAGIEALEQGHDSKKSSGAAPQALNQVASLLQRKDETIKEAHDRLLRLSADFENYKKRSRKEQDDASHRASEKFLLGLLPIIDSFERTLEHSEKIQNPGEAGAILDGIRLIQRQTASYLEQMGVKPIEALAKPFDPRFHEAILQEPSENTPHMHVLRVVEKGYLFREKLLRAAKVVVANNPTAQAPDPSAPREGPIPVKC